MMKNRIEERGSITSDLASVVCSPSRMARGPIRIRDQGLHPQGIGRAVPVAKAATATLRSDVRYGARNAAVLTCSSLLVPRSSINGFSLVSAIFLLVVIAALGTFAVTLSITQQQSAALDVQGTRAYQAARAGIEWGAYQALRNNSCAATTPLAALPNTLANFTVTVDCTSAVTTEAGVPVTMYQLTSRAAQGTVTTSGYVERQMTVTIAK